MLIEIGGVDLGIVAVVVVVGQAVGECLVIAVVVPTLDGAALPAAASLAAVPSTPATAAGAATTATAATTIATITVVVAGAVTLWMQDALDGLQSNSRPSQLLAAIGWAK